MVLLLALDDPTLKYEVVDKVGWRADRELPAVVEETYRWDAAADDVVVRVVFDRKGFAPLPPMLALAIRQGFPIRVSEKLVDTGKVSPLGPLMGVEQADGYTWRLKGLGKLVSEPRPAGEGQVPVLLQQTLVDEVEKILAAGHLAPWLFLVNVPGSGANDRGDVYWSSPADTLYLLVEVAPLLPPPLQARLKEYLTSERNAFPPERVRSAPLAQGARREAFAPEAKLLKQWEERTLGHALQGAPGVWNLYGLSRYCDLVGETPTAETWEACRGILQRSLEHRDWATLYWKRGRTPGFNAVHEVNRLFAGLVGYVRLARRVRDAEAEALGMGLLARAATLRVAMAKYPRFLHESRQFSVAYGVLPNSGEVHPGSFTIQVETDPKVYSLPEDPAWWVKRHAGNWIGELVAWSWTTPLDNVRQVHRLDETGVDVWEWAGVDCNGTGQKRAVNEKKDYWYNRLTPHQLPFRDLTPELARLLAVHARPECDAYVKRVLENQPHAHAAYAEAILSAEIGFSPPCDAYGQVLARAWILGDRPETLVKLIDVPWLPRGDLYYLHKLGEAARAYRAN
jgi:hypothetical protein